MLICILLLMLTTGEVLSVDRNPCSANPSLLIASTTPKHISSPYNQDNQYLPYTDCQFLLRASSPDRRISIAVISSKLEEPLFGNCTDFITARDGDQRQSNELVTWCGHDAPLQIVGTTNSLFLAFHTDGFVQSNGFNLTYVEFEVPGCPPGWITQTVDNVIDPNDRYCYWLGGSNGKELSWSDAQDQCAFNQANLVAFDTMSSRAFVENTFKKGVSKYWTAYNSVEEEDHFVSVDGSRLPEDFPDFANKLYTEDCILMSYNFSSAYEPSDCRKKHHYICARRYDGSTQPPREKLSVRGGLAQASLDLTYWVLIVVVIIILLVICCITIGHCKDRLLRVRRVEPADDNRLGWSEWFTKTKLLASVAASRAPSTIITVEPNQTNASGGSKRSRHVRADKVAALNNVAAPIQHEGHEQTPVETIVESHAMNEMKPSTSSARRPDGIEEGRSALRTQAETHLELPQENPTETGRLETELSLASSKQASNLAHPESAKKEMFVRPRMSLLEHSSAISLDDFWKNI